MAILMPSLSSCAGRMQAGERRFSERLLSHLEDDYLCWFDQPVGKRARYSDFIILHPLRGLLLLEVKDWKRETLKSINRVSAEILTNRGLKTVLNPMEQVRQCTYRLVATLESDPQLVHPDGRYKGKLVMPYGFGVVLSNISRSEFDESRIGEVLPEHRVICKDEMTAGVDAEGFQKRLWDMFDISYRFRLTLPQTDRVRWHIFPEVRIQTDVQTGLFDAAAADADVPVIPDLIKVMDLQQEQLARSLGDGHRVIHGVAGSGKTMILAYRCLHLARLLHKPILVLCYNITLAARLRGLIRQQDIEDKVNVYHFHDWCGELIRSYHLELPENEEMHYKRMVDCVVAGVENETVPRGQYGAILIDEGHDLAPEWLKLITTMVDPSTDSLLLLYDDAQSIYRKKSGLDFTLSSVGVQARGRTTVLKLNYRNTDEILKFAYEFVSSYLQPGECDEDHVPVVEPDASGRHGPQPVFRMCESFTDEAKYVAELCKKLHERRSMAYADMCVTYSERWMGRELCNTFKECDIPAHWLGSSREKKKFDQGTDSVKLMTMHSSKGLEFPMLAACGVGNMAKKKHREQADAKLLYVAMTRSTQNLLITASKANAFTERLAATTPGESATV